MPKPYPVLWMSCILSLLVFNVSTAAQSDVGAAADWASHGGGTDESGYSRLDAINATNIRRLGLNWFLDLPGEISLEATPLAVNGVLYFTGSYATVYAVDALTGKLSAVQLKETDVAAGRAMYTGCMGCHGRNLVSSGAPAPDLRESQIALEPDAFWAVLHDGALLKQGMPQYEMLSREQAMQIFDYIRAGARDAIKAKSPGN